MSSVEKILKISLGHLNAADEELVNNDKEDKEVYGG